METVTAEKPPKPREHAMMLAERIGIARKRMHPPVSQRMVAKELGVASATVSLWESAGTQPNVDTIVALARWFNVSVDWLYGLTTETVRKSAATTPDINTVPILPAQALARWDFNAQNGILQTKMEYLPEMAAAVRIETTTAMGDLLKAGGYAVVKRATSFDTGDVVMVLEHGAKEPVVRRVAKDGATIYYMPDDSRFAGMRPSECKLIGKVSEIISHSLLN